MATKDLSINIVVEDADSGDVLTEMSDSVTVNAEAGDVTITLS